MRVLDDLGAIGRGASAAHYVLAENGIEYIIKGPSFTPQHPYVAANELLAALIARQLGLPILDFAVVQMGQDLFFASAFMQGGTFHPQIRTDLFDRCENKERVYGMLVFDAWICNIDRHDGNLLVRTTRRGGQEHTTLLLNDHIAWSCPSRLHPGWRLWSTLRPRPTYGCRSRHKQSRTSDCFGSR